MCESKACTDEQCEVPYGLCHCGCGEAAPLAKETRSNRGIHRGEPYRFARQHHMRGVRREAHPSWKGGRILTKSGYWLVAVDPAHPMADANQKLYEHRLVMARVLGRSLARAEHVHHINGNRQDNRPENLELLSHREHMRRNSKLVAADVAIIKRRLLDGERRADLADEYGVSLAAIGHIGSGRSWETVEPA
jgi:hypothetical protein